MPEEEKRHKLTVYGSWALGPLLNRLTVMRKREDDLRSAVEPVVLSKETMEADHAFREAISDVFKRGFPDSENMLLRFREEVKELKELASRADDESGGQRYAEDLSLLNELLSGPECPFILEIPDDELDIRDDEPGRIRLHGPVETFIENKWDTLCKVHSLNVRMAGVLVEDATPPDTFVLDTAQRRMLETLAGLFTDGAGRYPGLAHKVMSWPITRYMPRPPKDEFPDFTFPKASRDLPYNWRASLPTQVLATRETLTTTWLVPHPKANWDADIGRQRFASLAQEAGEIVGRILPDCPIWKPMRRVPFFYCNLWLQTMHLLRQTCRHDDGWDGLFDDDSDFWDEGFRKSLYKFWKSDDVFLDSALACNTLLAGGGDYQRVCKDTENWLVQDEKADQQNGVSETMTDRQTVPQAPASSQTNDPDILQIEEYADRVNQLCEGEELPHFEAATPGEVRRDAKRRASGNWQERATRILNKDWHPVRRIFERRNPQKVRTLKELRQAVLDGMKEWPDGGIQNLEPAPDDRLVPNQKYQESIRLFADELSYGAKEMKEAAPDDRPGQKRNGPGQAGETGGADKNSQRERQVKKSSTVPQKARGRPRKYSDAICQRAGKQFDNLYAKSNDATGAWNTVADNLYFPSGEAARKAYERYRQSQLSGQNGHN